MVKTWMIYIPFNLKIWPESYAKDKSFNRLNYTFVKFNDIYSFEWDPSLRLNMIKESSLPIRKSLNSSSFKDQYGIFSVIYHIYVNRVHDMYNYVGVLSPEIDLRISSSDYKAKNLDKNLKITAAINDIIQAQSKCIIALSVRHQFSFLAGQNMALDGKQCMKTILEDYNRFTDSDFSFDRLLKKNPFIPTLGSFITDVNTFEEIGKFVQWVVENKLAERQSDIPSKMMDRYIGVALALHPTPKIYLPLERNWPPRP